MAMRFVDGSTGSGSATAGLCKPLTTKLQNAVGLSPPELAPLISMIQSTRQARAGDAIIRQGEKSVFLHVLASGWAARIKHLPDGSRQITAFLIPGDLCDLQLMILEEMDHDIVALTAVTLACIAEDALESLPLRAPEVAHALWRSALVDEAILRQWLTSVGRRDARSAIAHMLCELHFRMTTAGLARDDAIDLPITQAQLADATGLTGVHVNRVLQGLRGDGLITLSRRQLTIHDIARLGEIAGFDATYLRLKRKA
jgi:CRP-like cAMP-binding protein